MLESRKEKLRKDRNEDKNEKSWNNVGNVQDFRLLGGSYRGKLSKKVKSKDHTIPAKKCFELRKKTLEMSVENASLIEEKLKGYFTKVKL